MNCDPRKLEQRRAPGGLALVHGQDREGARPDARHPGPRRGHQRPGDGLAHGRVRQAPRPHARVRDRQADRARRLVRARGRDRPRRRATCSGRPLRSSDLDPGRDAPSPSRASATSAPGRRGSCSSSARRMVAVSDASGAIRSDAASTPRSSAEHVREGGTLAEFDGSRADRPRRPARRRVRRLHPRGARRHDPRGQRRPAALPDDRRGRQQPDHARGRRDPRRQGHLRRARHAGQRRRRGGLLLRVGPEPPALPLEREAR